MKKFLLLGFLVCFTLYSCDDGDITNIQLNEFDDELALCTGFNNNSFIIYNTITDPAQAVFIEIPASNASIFNPSEQDESGTLEINDSTIRFIYRTYNEDPTDVICQSIPDSDISVIENYSSATGNINYTSSFVDNGNTRTITINFSVDGVDLEILRSLATTDLGNLVYTISI